MSIELASLEVIEDFLTQKCIAIVGMSRDPKSMSTFLFQQFSRRGYDVVPVNPNIQEVLGQKCFARVQDIAPPVDAALLMTAPQVTELVVSHCAAAGIRRVWMHRGGGQGAVSEHAVEVCRGRGINVIPGECPLMFLARSGGIHSFHGFLRKLFGRYPKRAAAKG
jgi:predicted CoA-binding protein